MRKEVLIIIPAYNEVGKISEVLKALERPEISVFSDVLVMDDASRDGTNIIAKRRGHQVVTHVYNLGYGSGLQTGYKYADRRGYDYVIQMDADGQHDPENVKRIYEELKKKDEKGKYPDIVIGSRFVDGAVSFKVGAMKKFAFHLFRGLIKIGTGKMVMDPTSGLQGLSKRVVWYYSRYSHFDDRYPDANMLLQMLLLGYSVREIPAIMYQRTEGKSMHAGIIKPALYMIRMLLSMVTVWVRVKIYKLDKTSMKEQETINEIKAGKI